MYILTSILSAGIGVASVVFVTVVLWFKYRYTYWKRRGVFGPQPSIPAGNLDGVITKQKHLGDSINDFYRTYRHEPFIGVFSFHIPAIVMNDLDLIKQVLIKDFQHFNSHGSSENDELDPLAGHLFNLSGDRWKRMRTKFSPTFTTGKMRMMFEKMSEVQAILQKHLKEVTAQRELLDLKELFALFTTDVIGNCVFGIDTDSFKNPHSQFRKYGMEAISPVSFINQVAFSMQMLAPQVAELFRLRAQSKDVVHFFTKIVQETVEHREKNGVTRNDFMQLLIQMKNNELRDDAGNLLSSDGLTLKEMAAQTFLFFIAGFETSSTAAACALYQLALNPDIQEKARQDVVQVLAKNNGALTYEVIGEMKYLTMVIEETLRLHPTLSFLARKCTKDYKIPDSSVTLKEGNLVFIPVDGIHRDPELYTNPCSFQPERFTPDEKAKRHSMAWIPFGTGPRMCIAYRFGIMQIRLALVAILSKYEVSPCKRTQVPFIVDTAAFATTPRDGIWLKVKPIEVKT